MIVLDLMDALRAAVGKPSKPRQVLPEASIDFAAEVLQNVVDRREITVVLWGRFRFLEKAGLVKTDYIRSRQVYKIILTEKGTELLQQKHKGVV
jgi:hypothetical protein